jgi:hypothetical protein
MIAVGSTDRKQALFENVVRLRRVERGLPPNRDLVAVRVALEEELGDTVSRRLAARLLGVSHAALDRWVEAGDVPVVPTPAGGLGVPVPALLDLRDAVEAERAAGRRSRHVLEPIMARGRERAERLDVRELMAESNASEDGHDRARRRSLAYHRALARGLGQPMVDDALRLLWKWRLQGRIDPRHADAWERLLRRPLGEIRQAIAADAPESEDLRQSSPFAGRLSEPERRKIVEQVR